MTKARVCTAVSVAVCALLCAALALAAFSAPQTVAAETSEIKISPDGSSVYAAYDGSIAYTTSDGALHLSNASGSYAEASAFAGECLALAMNATDIFLLSDLNGSRSLTVFGYAANGIGAAENVFSRYGIASDIYENVIDRFDGLTVDGSSLMISAGAGSISRVFELSPLDGAAAFFHYNTAEPVGGISDIAAADNTVYIVTENGLAVNRLGVDAPVSFIPSEKVWTTVAAADGFIFAGTDDGIYVLSDGSFIKVSDDAPDGMIRAYYEGDVPYLLVQNRAEGSVTQYSVTANGSSAALEYYNVFDNVIYEDPSVYDIVTTAVAQTALEGYFSPKNLRPVFELSAGDLVLVLAEADGYYFVRTAEGGEYGYLDRDALTLSEADLSPEIGRYAQPLQRNTAIREYPFPGSAVVAQTGPTDTLVVLSAVGSDGYPWYKVSFVTAEGEVRDGYVYASDVSAYVPFALPGFDDHATVNADAIGGGVNVYLLPEERDEYLVGTLRDGDEVTLAQDGLDPDSEWTKIRYTDAEGNDIEGYVKTANLSERGLTTLQITLIVVFSIVAVVTAIIVVILVKKRKRERYE